MTTFRSCLGSCLVGVGIIVLLALLMLVNSASAGEAYCDACKGDSTSSADYQLSKLDNIGNPNAGKEEVMPGLSTAQKNRVGIWKQPLAGFSKADDANESSTVQEAAPVNNTAESTAKKTEKRKVAEENIPIVRSAKALNMFAPINDSTGSAILLDISEEATEHIAGSVAIPYTNFLINGTYLRMEEEMTKLLGDVGISREDPVIIYGECMPCGGGPSPATFVYWIMRSLGQENVRVLDGTVKDWAAAGKPTAAETTILPAKVYTPNVNADFSADYSLVKSGTVQIVDARSMEDFGAGSIPGAIPIPNENVVINNRIRDETKLDRVFAILDKNQPVVVYTNTGVKASAVWFALILQGYDAKLYSYVNYWENQMASGKTDAINSTA
ncbi:MAG: rhodanese-like domain-containing protein [Methanothrix sp.]|nr:rhodanese-like domain-containing protein [Methanothrix sp.]MDD4448214.1 rhodanese-like domain-containing protein [Methanothrix sp.]